MNKEEIEEMLADYVTVTLKIPKQVAKWFKGMYTTTLEERLATELVDLCYAQIDNADPKMLIRKYGLRPVFKEYGLSVK